MNNQSYTLTDDEQTIQTWMLSVVDASRNKPVDPAAFLRVAVLTGLCTIAEGFPAPPDVEAAVKRLGDDVDVLLKDVYATP